jgi:hypothetical protein
MIVLNQVFYIIKKNDDVDINISNEEIEKNSFKLYITQQGIYDKEKSLFFKRKRREDIEQIFIDFLVNLDKEKKYNKNTKKFVFKKIY